LSTCWAAISTTSCSSLDQRVRIRVNSTGSKTRVRSGAGSGSSGSSWPSATSLIARSIRRASARASLSIIGSLLLLLEVVQVPQGVDRRIALMFVPLAAPALLHVPGESLPAAFLVVADIRAADDGPGPLNGDEFGRPPPGIAVAVDLVGGHHG